ncbi:MAG: phosphoribosyltransferase [Defluviitaleaceae bacterium]|nr:phosphoribosyltransferase [Defluviitaleaceae bacterium]MCL2837424.1 phosphoribosyltransferase [Defluviitaleaceae bacterium]
MEDSTFSVSLEKNPLISVKVTPGHFTTNKIHYNHYLDMGELKFNMLIARDVARELAIPYKNTTLVDCIVCMERTEVIGAYLAEELAHSGTSAVNSGREMHIMSPLSTTDNKLIFPDNRRSLIENKSIIILMASVTYGFTLSAAQECVDYYGGKVVGISAMFTSSLRDPEEKINGMFTAGDIPGFKAFRTNQCEMCQAGQKLDAVIFSEGYTLI